MTALVDHAHDHDLVVQGNQAARSRALTHLLEVPGLPTVSTWSVDDMTDQLVGRVYGNCGESTEQQRAAVAVWAEFLRADVTEDIAEDGRITVTAEGRCEYGVPVRITALLRADTPQESAA